MNHLNARRFGRRKALAVLAMAGVFALGAPVVASGATPSRSASHPTTSSAKAKAKVATRTSAARRRELSQDRALLTQDKRQDQSNGGERSAKDRRQDAALAKTDRGQDKRLGIAEPGKASSHASTTRSSAVHHKGSAG